MVASVQHLHGKPVALSDPSDQDFVRSRLCRTQWPSRKVGRNGLPGGSTGKARFFNLSPKPAGICDVAHKIPSLRDRRANLANRPRKNGIIIRKYLLQNLIVHTDLNDVPLPRPRPHPARARTPVPTDSLLARYYRDTANFHRENRGHGVFEPSVPGFPKDTKPKGFSP
jgi:hypothetical protein